MRRDGENVCHPGILPDIDLASTGQCALAHPDLQQGGLFFDARIDCSHTYRRSSAEQSQTGPSVNDRFFTVTVTTAWRVSWTSKVVQALTP